MWKVFVQQEKNEIRKMVIAVIITDGILRAILLPNMVKVIINKEYM